MSIIIFAIPCLLNILTVIVEITHMHTYNKDEHILMSRK